MRAEQKKETWSLDLPTMELEAWGVLSQTGLSPFKRDLRGSDGVSSSLPL